MLNPLIKDILKDIMISIHRKNITPIIFIKLTIINLSTRTDININRIIIPPRITKIKIQGIIDSFRKKNTQKEIKKILITIETQNIKGV